MMRIFLLSALILTGCSHTHQKTDLERVFKRIPDREYQTLIDKSSFSDRRYEGFYNTYEVRGTLINSEVQEALLQREGYYMQWEASQARNEREKAFQEMSSSTKVFISLYTPTSSHNDLHRGNSMWKVFLEVDGLRYPGKVQHFNKNLAQTQNLFPYHTRFNKGYIASFDIPTSATEKAKSVFILTSSLGTTTVSFP